MKVFADLHHSSLFESFRLLFEKRFGWELYCPIGLKWFNMGLWHVGDPYQNPEQIALQYLDANRLKIVEIKNNIYYIREPYHNKIIKGITFDEFKFTKFDYIIASIPPHFYCYKIMRDLYQPQAKLVLQVGNNGWELPPSANIMCSTSAPKRGANFIRYHQEFDTSIFSYTPPKSARIVRSFLHLFPMADLFYETAGNCCLIDKCIPRKFEAYGLLTRNGSIQTIFELAKLMKESGFVWHVKPEGDGYGHIIHNTFAVGRPLITVFQFYRGCLAFNLFEDGVTCIDIGSLTPRQIAEKLNKFAQPEIHKTLCENAYKRFKEVVDFDAEAEELKKFFERCI